MTIEKDLRGYNSLGGLYRFNLHLSLRSNLLFDIEEIASSWRLGATPRNDMPDARSISRCFLQPRFDGSRAGAFDNIGLPCLLTPVCGEDIFCKG